MRYPTKFLLGVLIAGMTLLGLGAQTAMAKPIELERRRVFDTPYPVQRQAATPDGRLVAVTIGSFDQPLFVWETETGRLRHKLKVINRGGVVAFTPDGRYLITDPSIRQPNSGILASVFDLREQQWVDHLIGPEPLGAANKIVMHPNGRELAMIWKSHFVSIFEVGTWKLLTTWSAAEREVYTAMAYSPDGRLLALGTTGGYVEIYDRDKGRLLRRFEAHKEKVLTATFVGSHAFITTSTHTGYGLSGSRVPHNDTIRLWNVNNWEFISGIYYGINKSIPTAANIANIFIVRLNPYVRSFGIYSDIKHESDLEIEKVFSIQAVGGNCLGLGRESALEIWCRK